jgi:asparagine synthase (glutamine-hydrolysing)
MCGIVGFAGRPSGMDLETLNRCRDALAHRGPDASDSWISGDGRVALAHRRLAIVELSEAGAQPMHWLHPSLSIVFNGEIYNHHELREELRTLGCSFRGQSDTEVILAGYSRWGEGVFERLRGMFAIALYDPTARHLVLARDRAGEKPLYWARHRGGIVFASELTALFADPSLPRRLDPEGVNSYLAFGYVPADQCIVAGVSKVAPAHLLRFDLDSGAAEQHRFWSMPEPQPDTDLDEEALADELQGLLRSAVREQLDADVPVAVLLSGGIDSSLVTACAAAVSSRPVRTFSVGFPGEAAFDERPHARRVASHFGTQHVELELEPSSVDLIPELARRYDEPLADSSMIPTYLLSQLVAQHGKAVLGGDGGDELFGGYRAYQGALRLEAARAVLPRWLRRGVAAGAQTLLPVGYPGRNAVAHLDGTLAEGVARVGTMFDSGMRARLVPSLGRGDPLGAPERWKQALVDESRGVPGAFMASDFRSYLPGDILVKVDRASMASSLEVRAPFLDRRLIEFAFARVPNRLRTTGNERKILLRRLARKLLPPDFDVARKQGFSIPLAAWLTPQQRESACQRFEGRFGAFFDFVEVRRLLGSQHVGGVTRVFSLLMLMHWMEAHDVAF